MSPENIRSMMDNFNREVLRVAVAQICQSMGWDALQKSTHDTLTDVMQRYLEEIGKVAYGYTQLCNRTKPNLEDLQLAFQDTGVAVDELENYVAQVDPVQFIHPFATYPRCKPCRLQHPSKGEIVDRADFYSEYLPPLPKVCEEPKDEIEESPSEEYSKALDKDECEKMKTSPLKELNHVLETSCNVSGKRPHDTPMFLPQSKRVRPVIPANLNFEKKENLENTDGESLSPATPISPYVPQEIPKVPDEPAKEEVKVKIEPKKPSSIAKEMVLPLKKLTPPEKKTKLETSSPKKPTIKIEKCASPKVTKKLLASSPLSDSPSRKVKTEKLSPQKLKSPMKSRSPVVEKPAVVAKIVPEKSSKKQQSPLTSPVKGSPLKKKQSSVGARKECGSPVVGKSKDDKHAKKKKGKAPDETDAAKSTHHDVPSSEGLSTPKLTIKLLPKADARPDSSKLKPVALKSSVSPKKTPKTPESKKKIKLKVKALESENIAEPVGKVKISSNLMETGVKKEHGKKKKKKKDKDKEREKYKMLKTDKTERPIPKIRFKLDPSGESKVVETKPTVAPKIITSYGQESSKQTSLRTEKEKVSRSIITETLSTTIDYDPSKAYFCPVCQKKDDGSPMVGCDGCDEWCHWACVGLMDAPPEDEKWYCPQCLLRTGTTKRAKPRKRT